MDFLKKRIFNLALVFLVLIVELGCQTKPKINEQPNDRASINGATQMPMGDPWAGNARTGNWEDFEKLQATLSRPWDYRGANGTTALMVAARNGQISFIQQLLKRKVRINLQDSLSYNALSYALHGSTPLEKREELCLLLVRNSADPFAEDHSKLSPILVMIEFGFKECLKEVKLSDFTPCDQIKRLSEVTSLVEYAEKEEEFEIRDFLKSKGCQ
jgi:ankyrin repeat protein